ncbi:hypothetical protein [Streptomyces sp. H39-S7]|uniref:hypothetical protein n=1 Tax=Streptomyces sp. H39-S7 TaxID=3004357 RepID=UPI0022B03C3E|nr:hypothetical protein [Streptomyces sp. H39-S7]MCZ4125444.1 hypothetical protein [Streptomyces sp. H39-S7]
MSTGLPQDGGRDVQTSGGGLADARTHHTGEAAEVATGSEQDRDGKQGVPTEQERQLVAARKLATRAAVALVREPFAPDTVTAVQAYLADATQALASYAQLQMLPSEVVRARIADLTRGGRDGEACS